MPSAGSPYNQTFYTDAPPDEVIGHLVTAIAGMSGYTFNNAGTNSLVVTRKYTPTWAVVVAVVGLLVFLIGLLALLVKTTEIVTFTARRTDDGRTVVNVSGVASAELVARVNAVVNASKVPNAAPVVQY